MDQEIKPTILIVDDTPANIEILAELLQGKYKRKVALNGPKALEIARAEPHPDLILLDIMMPEMDGFEVCEKLKADNATKDIPVIFVTAMDEMEDEARGLEIGAVDYITKPISPPIVEARIRTHLRLKHSLEEVKHQNKLLKEYARLRDDVERITRHDLKTPLTAVTSAPELLMNDTNLTEEQRDILKMVEESAFRMTEIINSSLDMYKMEIGTYELNAVPVNVAHVLGQIRGETRQIIADRNVTLEIQLDGKPAAKGDLFNLMGDEMLFYSMMANLIKNAVEASPEGGTVRVFLETGDEAIIQVHNQGAVPEEIQETFFDKFVTSGKSGGTGLGTYSARLTTKTLGGIITMDTSEEEGTTITIVFPDQTGEIELTPEPEKPV